MRMIILSTKANVTIGENDYHIIIDGYPEIVVPTLKSLVDEAYHFGRGHGFAEFEYTIGKRGGVYWRRYNNKCWQQKF